MRAILQNFKSGKLSVTDAPAPVLKRGHVLVDTHCSLISAGTDRAIVGLAKKGYLGKALDRPDLAKKVINRARNEGFWSTFKVVQNLISEPLPLGYSLVGKAIKTGQDISHVKVGQRVACAGLGYANHADLVNVPQNLCVTVPDNVNDEDAAYVTLGAIAMQGMRQAEQQLGANVMVIGLGLVGLITVQLCVAAGYRVIGVDIDPSKFDLASKMGAAICKAPNDPNLAAAVAELTRGAGMDAVLLTAASRDSGKIFDLAATHARDRAKIVVVGDIKMDLSRRQYFQKDLQILQSRSYGPGRYDLSYEEKGQDYPIGYVRWTEQRNMEAFLDMISAGKLDMSPLTTHRFNIKDGEQAYDLVTGKTKEFSIGVLLTYDENGKENSQATIKAASQTPKNAAGKTRFGLIGAGQFAKGILLPAFSAHKKVALTKIATAKGVTSIGAASKYKLTQCANAADIFKADDVDGVIISTRHNSHARFVCEALKHNKFTYVEKPLCLNEEELSAIEEALQNSQGNLMVGFNRRYSRHMQKATALFEGRREPLSMIYRVNAGRIPLNSEIAWVHDPESGGGRIIGEVCHFIDCMCAMTDSVPVSVHANAIHYGSKTLSNEDTLTLHLTFADGSIGSIHYFANGDKAYPKERFEIFGQEKIAVIDNYRKTTLTQNNWTRGFRSFGQDKGFSQMICAYMEACADGLKTPIDFETLKAVSLTSFAAVQDLRDATLQNSDNQIDHLEERSHAAS
jgi:predicted dehydrogenase/threonine dehydrogenase-like Zn-dependent dehydrogenase